MSDYSYNGTSGYKDKTSLDVFDYSRKIDPPRASLGTVHSLKTAPYYFHEVKNRIKNFEVRQYSEQPCGECLSCKECGPCRYDKCNRCSCEQPKAARNFKVGDTIFLYNPETHEEISREITYILLDHSPCMQGALAAGWCILGLK